MTDNRFKQAAEQLCMERLCYKAEISKAVLRETFAAKQEAAEQLCIKKIEIGEMYDLGTIKGASKN